MVVPPSGSLTFLSHRPLSAHKCAAESAKRKSDLAKRQTQTPAEQPVWSGLYVSQVPIPLLLLEFLVLSLQSPQPFEYSHVDRPNLRKQQQRPRAATNHTNTESTILSLSCVNQLPSSHGSLPKSPKADKQRYGTEHRNEALEDNSLPNRR